MTLDEEFEIIKEFVEAGNGNFRKPVGKKIKDNTKEHFEQLKKFLKSARPEFKQKNKKKSKTKPDIALWEFIKLKYNLEDDKVSEYSKFHKIAMSYEGILGNFLEEFIYLAIKNYDWIWCSGSIVQDIDFIKKNNTEELKWTILQVKNSDISENAASSRVRPADTNIIKWYRRFSKDNTKHNWIELIDLISEDDDERKELLTEKLTEEKYK